MAAPACGGAGVLLLALLALLAGWGGAYATSGASPSAGAAEVPTLPFDDNPDPDQCGIPTPLGEGVTATLEGTWQGERVFPEVHLYDGHLRNEVTGMVPSGSTVRLVMYQNNPVLDYWLVRWEGPDGVVEGWAPDPFVVRDD